MLFWLGFIFTLTYSSWHVYRALICYEAQSGFLRLSFWMVCMIFSTAAWMIILRYWR